MSTNSDPPRLTPGQVRALQALVGAIIGLLVAFGALALPDPEPEPPSIGVPSGTGVVHDQIVTPDANTEISPSEQVAQGATGVLATPEIHEDLKDEQPPGAPPNAGAKVAAASASVETEPPVPPAGAQNYSCPRKFVVNYNSRRPGAKVTMFVIHYTVSGHKSLWAIYRLFNTPSFGASSHLILQPNGLCRQIVPWSKNAWTQVSFNSVSESVEITAMGTESRSWWLRQRIFTRGILASIVRDRLRARGLPLRRVNPVGCTPKAGWTDHDALECGNNHHDVKPTFPYDVLARQIRSGVVTPTQRRCRELRHLRAVHKQRRWTARELARARRLKSVLGPRADRCK